MAVNPHSSTRRGLRDPRVKYRVKKRRSLFDLPAPLMRRVPCSCSARCQQHEAGTLRCQTYLDYRPLTSTRHRLATGMPRQRVIQIPHAPRVSPEHPDSGRVRRNRVAQSLFLEAVPAKGREFVYVLRLSSRSVMMMKAIGSSSRGRDTGPGWRTMLEPCTEDATTFRRRPKAIPIAAGRPWPSPPLAAVV